MGGAFDERRLRELRAEIGVWSKLAEKGFAERLGVSLAFRVGLLDLRGAPGVGVPAIFTGASVAKPNATKKEGS